MFPLLYNGCGPPPSGRGGSTVVHGGQKGSTGDKVFLYISPCQNKNITSDRNPKKQIMDNLII